MNLNTLPSGTLATFFLTAVGLIQHTNEDDIGREKTILMTSLRLERAAAVRRWQVSITIKTGTGGAVCKGATPSVEQPGGRGFKPRLRSLLD